MKSLILLIVTTLPLILNEEAYLTKKFIYRMNLIMYMPIPNRINTHKVPRYLFQVPPTPPNTKIKQNPTNAN